MLGNCGTIESASELPDIMEDEKGIRILAATINLRKPTLMLRSTLKNPTMIGSGGLRTLPRIIIATSKRCQMISGRYEY